VLFANLENELEICFSVSCIIVGGVLFAGSLDHWSRLLAACLVQARSKSLSDISQLLSIVSSTSPCNSHSQRHLDKRLASLLYMTLYL
jgi:hypothetical protein